MAIRDLHPLRFWSSGRRPEAPHVALQHRVSKRLWEPGVWKGPSPCTLGFEVEGLQKAACKNSKTRWLHGGEGRGAVPAVQLVALVIAYLSEAGESWRELRSSFALVQLRKFEHHHPYRRASNKLSALACKSRLRAVRFEARSPKSAGDEWRRSLGL